MDEPFEVPATGVDVYRCFVMPTNLPAERSLAAIEVLPGNPRVVHHTFSYVDNRGLGRERDAADQKPGYMCFSGFTGDRIFGLLGGWTPGNEPHPFGEGIGLEVPAGVDVVMQVHYHPSGKPETDRTRLGLHLSKSPIRQALEWVSACADPATFVIPAGEPDHRIGTMLEVPFAVELHAMTPHMHMLGRRFRASVRFPEGRTRTLIEIDDWDFNRQDTYNTVRTNPTLTLANGFPGTGAAGVSATPTITPIDVHTSVSRWWASAVNASERCSRPAFIKIRATTKLAVAATAETRIPSPT